MSWVGRVGLAAIGVGLALVALEIDLRVRHPDVPIIGGHARLGTLARPNLDVRKTFGSGERVVRIATNADGLRTASLIDGPVPGVRRALALGDSFTFGAAVEADEAWPARLEALLKRGRSPGVWQVVNAGVPGHGTGQQLLLYRMLEERLRPHVVVLGFTVVNDVLDNLCIEEATYTPKTIAPCFTLEGDRLRLAEPTLDTQAFAYRRPRLRAAEFLLGQTRRLVVSNPRLLALAQRVGLPVDLPWVPATIASWYDPRYAEPGWRLTQRLLVELRDHLAAERVPLVVLVIPAALQADPALQAVLRALGSRHAAVQAFLDEPARPQRMMLEFCVAAAIECIDTLPALLLERQRAGRRTYYAIDNHWTPDGHRLAAALVARRLGVDDSARDGNSEGLVRVGTRPRRRVAGHAAA